MTESPTVKLLSVQQSIALLAPFLYQCVFWGRQRVWTVTCRKKLHVLLPMLVFTLYCLFGSTTVLIRSYYPQVYFDRVWLSLGHFLIVCFCFFLIYKCMHTGFGQDFHRPVLNHFQKFAPMNSYSSISGCELKSAADKSGRQFFKKNLERLLLLILF